MSRAIESAIIIGKLSQIETILEDERLVERSYGVAEGLDIDEAKSLYPLDAPVPERESPSSFHARIDDYIDSVRTSIHSAVLIISHGEVIWTILQKYGHTDTYIETASFHKFELR